MAERQVVPVLPLRQVVLLPSSPQPFALSRPAALKAVEAATQGDRLLFAVLEREPVEPPTAESLNAMGVLARVNQVQVGLGSLQVILTGEQRATAVSYRSGQILHAVVVPAQDMAPINPDDPAFRALYREVRERAAELARQRGVSDEVLQVLLGSVQEPGAFCDLVANHLDLRPEEKQHLLETLGVEPRLRAVLVQVQRELELVKAQQEIKNKVAEELGGRQRELYLREQLKAIRRELGEQDGNREKEELRAKLDKLDLPEDARSEVERELGRLDRAGAESVEAQVIRTYLQWISELPWNHRSEDTLDLARAAKILDEDHYGLADVKDRVLEYLAVRVLKALGAPDSAGVSEGSATEQPANREAHADQPTVLEAESKETDAPTRSKREAQSRAMAHGPILLFIGPPGVGKTSIAQSIARALGRKYVRVALGGARDEADIRGHRRTYVGALPGRVISGLKHAGTKNPVFLLDELDKLGVSMQGDPASALLEVLDPAQNHTFTDHYLGIPFDLSEVLFIATGNFIHKVPGPLLDRMEVVEFAGYTEAEKVGIAESYLVPRQLRESGLVSGHRAITFSSEALGSLISEYTRESGVRQLEREIGAVLRKVARRAASGEALPERIDADLVRSLLGRARVRSERAATEDELGAATGMYYTPSGGDIMFVEAVVRQRRLGDTPRDSLEDVSLILTGQLGEVMRESARAALTYVTAHHRELSIPPDRLGSLEVHVHVPAGAIPKDGPSAGVTIAVALASALSGRKARKDVAMTGEVTLRGRVLPIGGVKEKVLGAHRAGITNIMLPAENARDVEEIAADVRGELLFHFVGDLAQAFDVALLPTEPGRASHSHAAQ